MVSISDILGAHTWVCLVILLDVHTLTCQATYVLDTSMSYCLNPQTLNIVLSSWAFTPRYHRVATGNTQCGTVTIVSWKLIGSLVAPVIVDRLVSYNIEVLQDSYREVPQFIGDLCDFSGPKSVGFVLRMNILRIFDPISCAIALPQLAWNVYFPR